MNDEVALTDKTTDFNRWIQEFAGETGEFDPAGKLFSEEINWTEILEQFLLNMLKLRGYVCQRFSFNELNL